MITTEQKQTLQDVLRLDTVYGLLQYHERINVRGVMLGWDWAALSDNVRAFAEWLRYNAIVGFEVPALRVGQDRITYVYDELSGVLYTIEDYRKLNAHIAEMLEAICK